MYYISYTIKFEDLILNGVALSFILQVDELIFQALVPRQTKVVVDKGYLPEQKESQQQENDPGVNKGGAPEEYFNGLVGVEAVPQGAQRRRPGLAPAPAVAGPVPLSLAAARRRRAVATRRRRCPLRYRYYRYYCR
eukprot:gene57416-biopygen88837